MPPAKKGVQSSKSDGENKNTSQKRPRATAHAKAKKDEDDTSVKRAQRRPAAAPKAASKSEGKSNDECDRAEGDEQDNGNDHHDIDEAIDVTRAKYDDCDGSERESTSSDHHSKQESPDVVMPKPFAQALRKTDVISQPMIRAERKKKLTASLRTRILAPAIRRSKMERPEEVKIGAMNETTPICESLFRSIVRSLSKMGKCHGV